jgi:major membrane immunogen (membrane-anchored lipoprotein)
MASIQSMLALGALVIFSIISLLFNSSVLQNSTIEIEDKVYLTAFSLADDLIEEMKQKAFDEKTVDFQAIKASQLTPEGSFNDGETWPYYDDIDDYNGYSKPIDAPHAEGYVVKCHVEYCDANGTYSSIQTYYKKVTITVSSDYLRDDFQMYFIFSLHSKN